MSEIVNKFLLPGDNFIPEMHLRQPGFTCNASVAFTKIKEKIQKLKRNWRFTIYLSTQTR